MSKISAAVLFTIWVTASLVAKDAPTQVINWPQTGSVVVRITLGKFKEISSVAGQHNYLIDTTAENLWSKKISHLGFNLYLYDKNKVRIGDGWITIENVPPGQSVKFQTTVHVSAHPYRSNWLLTRCPLNCNRSPRRKSMDDRQLYSSRRSAFGGWRRGWHHPYDRIELRDGTVLSGDLVAVSGMEVRVRVAGTIQSLDRNKEKRILLTERDPAN